MKDLFKDLSIITGVKYNTLFKVISKSCALINHYVKEELKENNSILEIDIGIGILYIQMVEDCIKYKFIPAARLEKSVKSAFKGSTTDTELTDLIDTTLEKRITDTYKELL